MSSAYNTDGIYGMQPRDDMSCLDSIECAIAFDVGDWFDYGRRTAWVYCIVYGIDQYIHGNEESQEIFKDICREYHWDDADLKRLRKLHEQWEQLKENLDNDANRKDSN